MEVSTRLDRNKQSDRTMIATIDIISYNIVANRRHKFLGNNEIIKPPEKKKINK